MAVDPTFGINKYGRPETCSESITLANNILATLFGKPGSYPTMPGFGMYIQDTVMRLSDDVSVDAIKAELVNQCSQFSEVVHDGTFFVEKTTTTDKNNTESPTLLIGIPTIIDDEEKLLAVGIINTRNGINFNFTWIND